MKYSFSVFCLCLFSTAVFAQLRVVTTTTDLAALAREVGGAYIDVKSLARGDQDPHYLEPKPSYAVALKRADLLIEVGLELEVGWLPVLLTQSHNGKVQRGTEGHLDASVGLPLLEIPSGRIDRSMGDVHPYGNPHYWLNPHNGLRIARAIAERLSLLDPEHRDAYEKNERQFEARLTGKIAEWERDMALFKGTRVVTYHKSFSYYIDWLGIVSRGFIEPKPGIPPSPAHILSLLTLMRGEKIPLILTENYYDAKSSNYLAKETGATLLVLASSVAGDAAIPTYEALFEYLNRKLKETL